MRERGGKKPAMHIVEYFKKDGVCLGCHCIELVTGGSNNPGQITQRSSPLPKKRVLPTQDAQCDVGFKMEPLSFYKRPNYSVNSHHVRVNSDIAAIT